MNAYHHVLVERCRNQMYRFTGINGASMITRWFSCTVGPRGQVPVLCCAVTINGPSLFPLTTSRRKILSYTYYTPPRFKLSGFASWPW